MRMICNANACVTPGCYRREARSETSRRRWLRGRRPSSAAPDDGHIWASGDGSGTPAGSRAPGHLRVEVRMAWAEVWWSSGAASGWGHICMLVVHFPRIPLLRVWWRSCSMVTGVTAWISVRQLLRFDDGDTRRCHFLVGGVVTSL
jgi:hypothetical protein